MKELWQTALKVKRQLPQLISWVRCETGSKPQFLSLHSPTHNTVTWSDFRGRPESEDQFPYDSHNAYLSSPNLSTMSAILDSSQIMRETRVQSEITSILHDNKPCVAPIHQSTPPSQLMTFDLFLWTVNPLKKKNKFSLNFRMTIYEQCLHFLVSSSIFKIGVAVTMFTRLWHICWHRKYLIFQPFLHMIPPSSCNQDRIMLLVLESTLVITPEFNDLQRWKGFLWGLSFWSWFCPTPLSPIPFRFCCTHPITWEVVFFSRTLFSPSFNSILCMVWGELKSLQEMWRLSYHCSSKAKSEKRSLRLVSHLGVFIGPKWVKTTIF